MTTSGRGKSRTIRNVVVLGVIIVAALVIDRGIRLIDAPWSLGGESPMGDWYAPVALDEGAAIPDLAGFDLLAVMGGPTASARLPPSTTLSSRGVMVARLDGGNHQTMSSDTACSGPAVVGWKAPVVVMLGRR